MRTKVSKDALAEMLIKEKKLTAEDLKDLMAIARRERKSVFHVITDKEIMSEDEMLDFLSDKLEIPTLNLPAVKVPKELIKLVPRKIAEKYHVFPISRIGDFLTVATCNPFEIMLHDDLKNLTQCQVSLVLVPPKMIISAIDNHYLDSNNLEEILEGIDENSLEVIRTSEEDEKDEGGLDSMVAGKTDEAPVVRMVNLILDEGIRARASDIHFEPYEKNFRVRYRIDGALKESFAHSRELYTALVARVKIIAQLDMTQKRLPQDGRFRARIGGREIDFRVSLLPTYFGEKIVLRVLDKGGVKSGFEKLGFSEKATQVMQNAIKRPYGMILVTGPTGSGKSTTLYSVLNTLNTLDRNLMTIEDPVEYQVIGITQTQVNPTIGLTFATGLRALLRQSPDIVLVGEIRDTETADIAVKAALTGHLVFSTLHTNSASGAVTRMVDMGVEPFLISSSVIAVAAQRLMRRICDHCKKEYEVPEDMVRRCKLKTAGKHGLKGFKGTGCAKCNQTGYFGRLGAIEILEVSPRIREMVLQRKSSADIQKVAVEEGMETLFENAFSHFKRGITSLEEVLRVASADE